MAPGATEIEVHGRQANKTDDDGKEMSDE